VLIPQKDLLRGIIKKRLKDIPREEFHSQGARAADLFYSSPILARYKTVFLFLSIENSEIDTIPLLKTALNTGKKVFAPRVEAKGLVFYPVMSAEGPWRKSSLGIKEPLNQDTGNNGAVTHEDFPSLILTPGLAFDREGNRLGRGGGYYDRLFAELDANGRQYTALGFCMDFQLIDQVPFAEHDKKVDGILTGKELTMRQWDLLK
jgi:5-formyltetrahydrofolate cyclo-ligase